jgi:hypothetical protein
MVSRKPYDAETCFPWSLVDEVVGILKARGAEFIRFADLRLPNGKMPVTQAELGQEYLSDKFGLKQRVPFVISRAASRLYKEASVKRRLGVLDPFVRRQPLKIIMQHDADRQPYKTVEMMRREAALGVVSSNYFFRRRNVWDDDLESYDLQADDFQELERAGFEIGYHLNAYELAGYDLAEARAIIQQDIAWFREVVNLRSYVPHGGVPGPGGLNNCHFPQEPPLDSLMWAYNGCGALTDDSWSDGNIGFVSVSDPRSVARTVPDGARIHFLMHPQYYGTELSPIWLDKPIAQQPWWRALWGLPT